MPDNTIERFAGPDYFLSNFYRAEIMWEGKPYPSSEHLYQAMKAGTEEEREWVRSATTMREAKFRGQRVSATADWSERRIGAMRSVLEAKFDQHPDLAAKLDATGDAELVEGNTWGDMFWGVDIETGQGENHLGKLLMELRDAVEETKAMAKYEKICDVASAFKSGELSQETYVMVIADGHSVLIKRRKPNEDYDPWEEGLWEGLAPLNVTAETCDALGIPHESA